MFCSDRPDKLLMCFAKTLFSTFSTAVTNLLLPQIAHSEKGKKIAFDQLKSSHAMVEHEKERRRKKKFEK
jgi:hypothetical protein